MCPGGGGSGYMMGRGRPCFPGVPCLGFPLGWCLRDEDVTGAPRVALAHTGLKPECRLPLVLSLRVQDTSLKVPAHSLFSAGWNCVPSHPQPVRSRGSPLLRSWSFVSRACGGPGFPDCST